MIRFETRKTLTKFEGKMNELYNDYVLCSNDTDKNVLEKTFRDFVKSYIETIEYSAKGTVLMGLIHEGVEMNRLYDATRRYCNERFDELKPEESYEGLKTFYEIFRTVVNKYHSVPKDRDAVKFQLIKVVKDYADSIEYNDRKYLLDTSCVITKDGHDIGIPAFISKVKTYLSYAMREKDASLLRFKEGFYKRVEAFDEYRVERTEPYYTDSIIDLCGWVNDYREETPKNSATHLLNTENESILDVIANVEKYLEFVQKVKEDEIMNFDDLRCVDCGRKITTDDYYTVAPGKYICNDCFEENYFECRDCGRILDKEYNTYAILGDGSEVCNSCLVENYTYCYSCEQYYPNDDIFESNDGECYCSDCYHERYHLCDICDEETRVCDVIEHDGRQICERCYNKLMTEGIIHDYHDRNVQYVTNYCPGDNLNFLVGIEHEVCGNKCRGKEFNDIVNGNDKESNTILFKDGSIPGDGFEIVTQPMTIEYLKKEFLPRYEKGIQFLLENGFSAEDGCGIHVHFTEMEDSMQIARLCNILYGTVDDIEAWCKITNRRRSDLNSYASMKNREYSTAEIISENRKTAIDYNDTRYIALNYDCRTGTHELRIFNSTMDIELYKTYIEITLSLLDFTSCDIGKGAYVNTRDYIEFIRDNYATYTLVHKYFLAKDLYGYYSVRLSHKHTHDGQLTLEDIFENDDEIFLSKSDRALFNELCNRIDEAVESDDAVGY